MNLKPLFDRVIVQRAESESVTQGGIVIPGAAAEKADQGTVLAIGPGARNEAGVVSPVGVAVGDRILFSKNAGQNAKVDGQEVLILKEDEILAVVNQ